MSVTGSQMKSSQNGVFGAIQPPHFPEQFAESASISRPGRHEVDTQLASVAPCTRADYFRFLVVAIYLVGVLFWLLVTRQLRLNFSMRRSLLVFLRDRIPHLMIRDPAGKET